MVLLNGLPFSEAEVITSGGDSPVGDTAKPQHGRFYVQVTNASETELDGREQTEGVALSGRFSFGSCAKTGPAVRPALEGNLVSVAGLPSSCCERLSCLFLI